MQWLNAALAFAITMLILSMVTSMFVETIHRILGMRVKGLKLLLGHFFDRVIALHYPAIDQQRLTKLRAKFTDLMTVNRAPPGTAFKGDISRTENDTSKDEGLWQRLWQGRRLDHLDVDGLMGRLGSSEFGDTIRANGAGATEEVLKDIAQKFDAFGEEASEFFERRARLLSVIVALFVSWGMFVHPYQLFSTYTRQPEVAGEMIKLQSRVEADYLARQKKAADAQAAIESAKKDLKTETNDELRNKKADDLKKLEDDWREAVQEKDDKLAELQQTGVPIGWNEERLAAAGFRAGTLLWIFPIPLPMEWSYRSWATVVWLVLGGLLIGLGGPFWYDIVTSLSNIRALLGSGKQDEQPAAASLAKATSQPQTPVEHFNAAAAAREAVSGSIGEEEIAVG